ncbi:MAG: sugar transferase [Lachnospiraceae bacterium]|nr:sugar transferase [Lachnospiraceae bacterium]
MNTMRSNRYKRIYRFAASLAALVMQSIPFAVLWMRYYNDPNRITQTFALRGNWLVIGIYVVLLFTFGNVYGGFKIGYQKAGSLILSQGITLFVTDLLMYIIIDLLARRIIVAWPMALLFVLQLLATALLAHLLTHIYDANFPPRKLLMVYGEYEEPALRLRQKMNGMAEKYEVTCLLHQSEPYETLCTRIEESQGVVLIDVDTPLRNQIMKYCYVRSIRVYVAPNLTDILLKSAEALHFFDTPLLLSRNTGLSIEQKLAKRVMDLVISGLGILVTSPIMLAVAAAIKLYDGGPVFFRQARATCGGKVFMITKFRSMVTDAEKAGYAIPATERDPRITPVGRVIRAARIDELPQLFDIFRGDMSVVGPRPERVEHVDKYTEEIPEFAYRLKVKGGLTGYAQIYGKYNTTAYDKLKLDLMYIENYSLLLDIKLILMTVKIMFMKESTEGFTAEASEKMHDAK